jgi:hypothetical protein
MRGSGPAVRPNSTDVVRVDPIDVRPPVVVGRVIDLVA